MSIQWFPGHMNKARRLLAEYADKTDGLLEIADARAPQSSRNPLFEEIFAGKPRLLLLNKSDLADQSILKRWQEAYRDRGLMSLAISVKTRHNLERLKGEAAALAKTGKTRVKPPRLMIIGVPNCGKSSLINALARQKKTQTADSPGITRDVSLYKLGSLDLVDSPGTLWPNLSDQTAAARLAALGCIKDNVYPPEEALELLYSYLYEHYAESLAVRYQCDPSPNCADFLRSVALRLGRSEADRGNLALAVFKDLRAFKLGPLCLEDPSDSPLKKNPE